MASGAAKRIGNSNVNWSDLAKRVPAGQKTIYLAFKAKSDGYLRKVLANPETPPAIDWASYKSKVPIAGLVDKFQKSYNELKVPYPAVPSAVTSELDAVEVRAKEDIASFKRESDERISKYRKELQRLANLIPYDQMTLEDAYDAWPPGERFDPLNDPTFWPHYHPDARQHQEKDSKPWI